MEIVKLPLSFQNRIVIIKCTASKGHLEVRENERKKMQKQMIRISYVLFLVVCLLADTGCSSKQDEMEIFQVEEEVTVSPEGKEDNNAVQMDAEETPSMVVVHVCGAVNHPGVYELSEGSRIFDAVNAAGGMTASASAEYLNQAAVVIDGQQLYVPTKEEMETLPNVAVKQQEISGQTNEGKVDLNHASKEELMTLTGIGEAKADSIIRYREEQGGFQSIEELMNIEGIKEGVFQKIKDDITVT